MLFNLMCMCVKILIKPSIKDGLIKYFIYQHFLHITANFIRYSQLSGVGFDF